MTSQTDQNPQNTESLRPPFDPAWYQSAYPDVRALQMDPHDHYLRFGQRMGRLPVPAERDLKRIAIIVPDLSTIGGIASRSRTLLQYGSTSAVEYVAITARSERGGHRPGEFCYATDPTGVTNALHSWLPNQTALIVSNNAIRSFPKPIRNILHSFPIVYICAGQMAFMIQDSPVLRDREYADRMRAMRIMSFSEGDIAFQRQLGIHGQVKGFAPVAQRTHNAFDSSVNRRLGYIGRVDFHAKDTARLIAVAQALRGSHFGPILIYTTDGRNSPQYRAFRTMIEKADLEDEFEFILNCTDKDTLYKNLAFLLVPSRKESFGNSIVEALSYGVPVVAASYAPGPAEILEHGRSGFLLDDFSGTAVANALLSVDSDSLERMSSHAFERHKAFPIEKHGRQIEDLARSAVADFRGENTLPIFPKLRILEGTV